MAKDFAEKFNSKIILLNVQTLPYQWSYSTVNIGQNREEYEEISSEILNTAKNYFDKCNIKAIVKMSFGDPAINIIDTANDEDCDLIIMCTHGMSAAKRFTIGSVTNKVVHHADKPVLVVR